MNLGHLFFSLFVAYPLYADLQGRDGAPGHQNTEEKNRLGHTLTARRSVSADAQISIPRIEQMPNIPEPYHMRDWQQVARDFDSLAFDFEKEGKYFPLISWDKSPGVNANRVFALPSFVGWNKTGYETITCLGAINSATVAGINKRNQYGQDWVSLCANYFNDQPEINLYLNSPKDRTGESFWYELFPNILFYRIFSHYPDTPKMANQFVVIAEQWRKATAGMKGNFKHTSYDFLNDQPYDNNLWTEGGSAAGIAWIEYMAYIKTGNTNFLITAKQTMDYLEQCKESPYYEVLLPHAPYIAARMNAEQGTNYDVEKLLNWCFDGSNQRKWGDVSDKWGDMDVAGLTGSLYDSEGGDYAFAMNTFNKANNLVPLVRYDDRFARAIGKWMLNAANSARLFYANALAADYQTDADWAAQHDPKSCLAYEGLRRAKLLIGRLESNVETLHGKIKSGTLEETKFTNNKFQVLEETHTGKRDRLEHIWKSTLPKSHTHELVMKVEVTGKESFNVLCAPKAEGPYTHLFTFNAKDNKGQWGDLPAEIKEEIYLKVEDSGEDEDPEHLDTFAVDDVWFRSKSNKRPFATGDAKENGWARTNFGLYGSAFAGLFGGIIRTTNIEKILQLDCLATDYFHAPAYPTYLYYNPYNEEKEVEIKVGTEVCDLYDAVSNSFLKKGISGKTFLIIPADSARLLVLVPFGKKFKDK